MRFWLDMGVDGFRLDAIPYLIERDGTSNENLPETHAVIKQLRAAIDAEYKNRFLLAEANMWPEDVREYFGDGDECHMAYHFPLMPRMYMAIAQEDRHPIVEIMQQTPDIPDNCQWAIFLRNHDELTLEMVTSKERDYMYHMYAADTRARINLGIRRRLAPLMENDVDRVKLMNSLLLSMPGSPIIYYGDEIGMGDNIFLGDRNGVRTPMQWSPDRNAGFSRADPQRLYLPPIMDPIYGYEAVNVEAQARDASSLLNWTKRMLAVRKTSHAFGRGRRVFLKPGNRKILAYLRELRGRHRSCASSTSRARRSRSSSTSSRLQGPGAGRAARAHGVPADRRAALPADAAGLRLLLVPARRRRRRRRAGTRRAWPCRTGRRWCCSTAGPASSATASCRGASAWPSACAPSSRRDTLPRYVEIQRWYAAKGTPVSARARRRPRALGGTASTSWMLPLLDARRPGRGATYFLPLALAWEERDEERMNALVPAALAKVRQQATSA